MLGGYVGDRLASPPAPALRLAFVLQILSWHALASVSTLSLAVSSFVVGASYQEAWRSRWSRS